MLLPVNTPHRILLPALLLLMLAAFAAAMSVHAAASTNASAHETPQNTPYQPRTRHYYIAAEDVQWDYAPSGKNLVQPKAGLGPWGERTTYAKTRYIAYTSDAFEKRLPQPAYLGVLGPVIRGVVGDTIKIHFRNKASQPYSIHPIGTRYDKADEGANYAGIEHPGGSVAPGESHTYTLHITQDIGPGPNDPSSILRLYRSHVQPVADVYRGLIGPIVITDAAHGSASGLPTDVDRAFINMFLVFNENSPGEELEGDLMHSINGYIAGNQPGLRMQAGDRVRWHTFAMGTEVDMHTPHWHGNGVMVHGHRKESLLLLPGIAITADMHADNPGTWLFKCNVGDHVTAHMMSLYHVTAEKQPPQEPL